MDLNSEILNNVAKSLSEDIGEDDLTALLIKSEISAVATVICREKSILCGTQWFDTCFKNLSPQTEIHLFAEEGDVILAGQELCKIK